MNLVAMVGALVRASVEGGVLILVVAAVTRLAPRVPAAARCALWWLASLRLMLGLLPLPAWTLALPRLPAASLAPAAPLAALPFARALAVPVVPAAHASVAGHAFDPWPVALFALLALWIAGAVGTIVLHLRDARRLGRLWRAATPIDSGIVRGWLGEWIENANAGRAELRASAELGSPMVMGGLGPRILLPASCLEGDGASLRMALAHEASHVRRRDLWWGWVPAVAECAFWFHPLAHWCVREYVQAREESCDADALRLAGAAPEHYGEMLVDFGVDGARRVHAATACGSSHAGQLQRRLRMLPHSLTISRSQRVLAAGALCAVLAFALVPVRFVSAQDSGGARGGDDARPGRSTTTTTRTSRWDDRSSSRSSRSGRSSYSYGWNSTGDENGGEISFGIVSGDRSNSSGSFGDGDFARIARLARNADGDLGWFKLDDTYYVVHDPEAIAELRETMQPQLDLGRKQGELGEQQGKLGEQQGKLGERQGELGARQGEIASRLAELESEMDGQSASARARLRAKHAELENERDAIDDEMSDLSAQQSKLGSRQSELGEIQSELGRRQTEMSRKVNAAMSRLTKDLVRRGVAVRAED